MTNISSLVLILICVGVGYIFEPIFFSGSRNSPVKPLPAAVVEDGEVAEPDAEPISNPEATHNALQETLSLITQADFPEKVTINVDYTLKDEQSGVTMQLKAGTKVKPLRLEGNLLVFQPVGLPIEGKTEVTNTDFKTLAMPMMLDRIRNSAATEVAVEPEPIVMPEPVIEPEPIVIPEPVIEPVIEPIVMPEPVIEAEVTPTPPVVANTMDSASIVALLKASVTAGQVTEFEATQVVSWNGGEPLVLNGQTYQTGLVTFKAETILGMQEHDAIALIENGAVTKWMWAKTKLEMR